MRGLNSGDFVFLLEGLKWTIGLSFCALLLGSLLAALFVAMRLLRSRVLDAIYVGYVGLFQGTPLIGQLFFFYFGLNIFLQYAGDFVFRTFDVRLFTQVDVPPFVSATVALGLYSAAFLGEIWRGAIQAVSVKQWEASESLGLGRVQTLVSVILPQAVRGATPPTVGFLVNLIKDSSLASVIGFVELMRSAQMINNSTFRPFTIYGMVALLYFLICFPITLWSRRLERRMAR